MADVPFQAGVPGVELGRHLRHARNPASSAWAGVSKNTVFSAAGFFALQLGRQHGLTMYDATYLAVEESAEARMLTLDSQLHDAAVVMGLGRDGGPRRISEPAAPYGDRPVDRTSIAAIGAALAEMRKEYSL